MRRSAVNARDAGFALIGRINRWLIAGAVVATGAVSLAAARSFHGHSTSAGSSATQSTGTGSSSSSSSGGLQGPSQAPSSSPAAPSPVVSGGS